MKKWASEKELITREPCCKADVKTPIISKQGGSYQEVSYLCGVCYSNTSWFIIRSHLNTWSLLRDHGLWWEHLLKNIQCQLLTTMQCNPAWDNLILKRVRANCSSNRSPSGLILKRYYKYREILSFMAAYIHIVGIHTMDFCRNEEANSYAFERCNLLFVSFL